MRRKKRKKAFKNLKIGVLMGGLSAEREVSLATGRAIYRELKKHGHKAAAIDVKDRSIEGIIKARSDVVINGLHGTYGEDGVMQGILDFLNIPYAGSGVLASAAAMDKTATKKILAAHKVLVPRWEVVENEMSLSAVKIRYPVVIKPAAEGSAVGVSIAGNSKEAKTALKKALKYGKKAIIEQYIKGVEISVPVLTGRALPAIEIRPQNEFYDYDAKYTPGKSTHVIPARIKKSLLKKAEKTALNSHRALSCRDFSRVDMIIKKDRIYVLEVNTLPGMTDVSLFPESAAKAGISFYGLLSILIKKAYGRIL